MTPKQAAKARRIIAKPWYNHYRAWKMHKMFHHWDEILQHDTHIGTDYCCKMLLRYAVKEAWYINKQRKGKEQ